MKKLPASLQADSAPPELVTRFLTVLTPTERQEWDVVMENGLPATLPLLTEILAQERTKRKKRNVAMRSAGVGLALLVALGGPLLISLLSSPTLKQFQNVILLTMYAMAPVIFCLLWCDPMAARHSAAFELLLTIDDQRSIGLVLEQLSERSGRRLNRVRRVLLYLLPRIKAPDDVQLTRAQLAHLHGILRYSDRKRHIELRLAAISALHHVGTWEVLARLYLLASGEAVTEGEKFVRDATRDCLQALQQRFDFGTPEDIPACIARLFLPPGSGKMPIFGYPDCIAAWYSLIALLPQMSAFQYHDFLTVRYRDRLISLLLMAIGDDFCYDKLPLFHTILETLVRAEDTRALNAVRKVAAMETSSHEARQLRDAAVRAVEALESAVARKQVSSTLLRGASAPASLPGELLRAAAPAVSETCPAELLRASTPQTEALLPRRETQAEEVTESVVQVGKDRAR